LSINPARHVWRTSSWLRSNSSNLTIRFHDPFRQQRVAFRRLGRPRTHRRGRRQEPGGVAPHVFAARPSRRLSTDQLNPGIETAHEVLCTSAADSSSTLVAALILGVELLANQARPLRFSFSEYPKRNPRHRAQHHPGQRALALPLDPKHDRPFREAVPLSALYVPPSRKNKLRAISMAAIATSTGVYLLRSGIARLAAFSTISAVTFVSPRAHFSLHSRTCLMVMSNSFWR
jgi:hypothetical protein